MTTTSTQGRLWQIRHAPTPVLDNRLITEGRSRFSMLIGEMLTGLLSQFGQKKS
jgi:hypothetical protein